MTACPISHGMMTGAEPDDQAHEDGGREQPGVQDVVAQ